MNLSVKQQPSQSEQTCGCHEGGGLEEQQVRSLGLPCKLSHRISKQGPTTQHRQLCSLFGDKS